MAIWRRRPARPRGDRIEALQWRASLVWEEYRDALLAHPDDRIALNVLAECFPELVWGLGTLRGMTQQQPAAL